MKQTIATALVFVTALFSMPVFAQSDHLLWYDKPAQYFEESLALGNGTVGASVFGGVDTDKIYLNDATLWSGEPVNAYMNPEAYKSLPAVRAALQTGNYRLADSLNHKLQGKFSDSYAPLGTLYIHMNHKGEAKKYYRELDISNAVSTLHYEVNGVVFTREYFVSYPGKIMVIRFGSSQKKALHFSIQLTSLLRNTVSADGNRLKMKGYTPIHTEPNYVGDVQNSIVYDAAKGTRFTTLVSVNNTGGTVSLSDSALTVDGATEAVVYVSLATSFNGFDKNPVTEGRNDEALASETLQKGIAKSFAALKTAHITDYQQFFNRVQLNLGKTNAPNLPTDERLMRYANGEEDKNLEVLYFQYGRYLLISSSRTPGVPANLQGIWNPYIRPPWSSNYTLNINLEENYWLAENTNLSEMHLPLMQFIQNLSKTGTITAKTFYGADGWVACHNSDIWAMSNPVGNFGSGDPSCELEHGWRLAQHAPVGALCVYQRPVIPVCYRIPPYERRGAVLPQLAGRRFRGSPHHLTIHLAGKPVQNARRLCRRYVVWWYGRPRNDSRTARQNNTGGRCVAGRHRIYHPAAANHCPPCSLQSGQQRQPAGMVLRLGRPGPETSPPVAPLRLVSRSPDHSCHHADAGSGKPPHPRNQRR